MQSLSLSGQLKNNRNFRQEITLGRYHHTSLIESKIRINELVQTDKGFVRSFNVLIYLGKESIAFVYEKLVNEKSILNWGSIID